MKRPSARWGGPLNAVDAATGGAGVQALKVRCQARALADEVEPHQWPVIAQGELDHPTDGPYQCHEAGD